MTLKVIWEVQATSCNHSHKKFLALDLMIFFSTELQLH